MQNENRILILYDGNCPICCSQYDMLQKRDKHDRLRFANIRYPEFDPEAYGTTIEKIEKQIHAVLPDGSVIDRMDVIRAAYREIGLGWLVAPTGWPILRPLFDRLYGFVAKHRLRISSFLRKHP